jgi:predicted RNase H-like HicB family nuclease
MANTLVPLLIKGFPQFLSAFDKYCPFIRSGQLEYHVRTIELRREHGSARSAIENAQFRRSLYNTLQAWQIGSRASRLKPYAEFEKTLVEELPGANTQGETLEEARANLQEAVQLVLESNRALAEETLRDKAVIREPLASIS